MKIKIRYVIPLVVIILFLSYIFLYIDYSNFKCKDTLYDINIMSVYLKSCDYNKRLCGLLIFERLMDTLNTSTLLNYSDIIIDHLHDESFSLFEYLDYGLLNETDYNERMLEAGSTALRILSSNPIYFLKLDSLFKNKKDEPNFLANLQDAIYLLFKEKNIFFSNEEYFNYLDKAFKNHKDLEKLRLSLKYDAINGRLKHKYWEDFSYSPSK